MKKILYIAYLCAFALGCCSGCGEKVTEEMGKDVFRASTGAAVSEHGASGQSVQTEEEGGSPKPASGSESLRAVLCSRYCSEHCYYAVVVERIIQTGLAQVSLETGEQRNIPFDDMDSLVYVEQDALYYTKANHGDESTYYSLWRLPIESRGDGTEELRTDRVEKVKGVNDIYCYGGDIYMDDTYIVYGGANENEDTVVTCYNRKNGKKVIMPASLVVQKYINCEIESIYRRGACMELVVSRGIVTWDMKTGKVKIYGHEDSDSSPCMNELLSTEDVCFYMIGYNEMDIVRVDMKTKKEKDFVSEEEIIAVLEGEAGVPKKRGEDFGLFKIYYDENHLYLQLYVEYRKDGKSYDRDIILSREDTKGAPLQYEKGLTEYLWDRNGQEDMSGDDLSGYADCYGFCRGMAYVMPEDSDDNEIVYDLKTGETRPVSDRDELLLLQMEEMK